MDVFKMMSSIFAWMLLTPSARGKVTCDCTTLDCQVERKRTCEAEYYCYVENMNSVVTRGCINDKTPLLCENRVPAKLASGDFPEWPFLFCCRDEDFCNRDIIPIKPTSQIPMAQPKLKDHVEEELNPHIRYDDDDDDDDNGKPPCPNNDSSKLIPIYIAVPIAGVCVLLALIIFAMYLLRRRNDLYANCDAYKYREQLAKLSQKQTETNVQGCDTNRCTDSERSSQGSATRLFLNA